MNTEQPIVWRTELSLACDDYSKPDHKQVWRIAYDGIVPGDSRGFLGRAQAVEAIRKMQASRPSEFYLRTVYR